MADRRHGAVVGLRLEQQRSSVQCVDQVLREVQGFGSRAIQRRQCEHTAAIQIPIGHRQPRRFFAAHRMAAERADAIGQRVHALNNLRLGRAEIEQMKFAGENRRDAIDPIENGRHRRGEDQQIDLIAAQIDRAVNDAALECLIDRAEINIVTADRSARTVASPARASRPSSPGR